MYLFVSFPLTPNVTPIVIYIEQLFYVRRKYSHQLEIFESVRELYLPTAGYRSSVSRGTGLGLLRRTGATAEEAAVLAVPPVQSRSTQTLTRTKAKAGRPGTLPHHRQSWVGDCT